MLDRKSTLVVRAQEDKTRRSRSTGERLQPEIEVSATGIAAAPPIDPRPGASLGRSIGWSLGMSVVPEEALALGL